MSFVHLRVRTEFSIVDGIVRVEPLMKAVADRGMNAVGVSDCCNFFAAVKVYQAAIAQGIKPILGVDLPCVYPDKPNEISLLPIICQNQIGYKNAVRLVSKAYLEGQVQGSPRVQHEWIPEYTEGLIALSGGVSGRVGQALLAGDLKTARETALSLAQLFPGRFYLEIQRLGRPQEAAYLKNLVALADELQLPLVATNEVRFLDKADFDAHEARVCIHQGSTLADSRSARRYTAAQYLCSATEMEALFHDLPQALANTVEIAKRCTIKLGLGQSFLPTFPSPEGFTEGGYLAHLSHAGLEQRLLQLYGDQQAAQRERYVSRLELELRVIQEMGFPGYFLIVADFIAWSKSQGIRVGPGRGSGAGSLVAYALQITDLDPLAYDLLFERFLNPERVSMPDFDIDFCMEGRDRVIEYVAEKYGRDAVSQIITFGTMAAKAVIRDVGRVLGHPYGFVDKLAKLIPFEIGMTLEKAMAETEELKQRYEDEEEVRELIDLAMRLEGITRNPGKHAGGVVIAPSALTDFTAIYCEAGSQQLVSQFDKDDVEAVGLVKFDFLGLRTLTIIDWTLKIIHREHQTKIDIEQIPLDCPKTFELLKSCKTSAVFQLESRGMKELVQRLKPDTFEEIIALVALFRPGPLQSGMVDDFISRKHGAQVEYPHPDLEPILKPTYGVILYQEQVMQIAQVLANYTLGAADLLRRAMGKKKPEEMAKQRAIFTEGAVAREVDKQLAESIFDLMEKFAGYGFNKSHSAAYALLAYQTAWLKAHYPAAFMAAVLSSDLDNTDKILSFIDACREIHLTILPPSILKSDYHFSVEFPNASSRHPEPTHSEGEGSPACSSMPSSEIPRPAEGLGMTRGVAEGQGNIRYGLGAIKGVGEAAVLLILEARAAGAPFTDLFAFCAALDLRKVNRRVLEALIKSGAMDEWGQPRAVLFASIDKAIQHAEQLHSNTRNGQLDLFSEASVEQPTYVTSLTWSKRNELDFEKEALGFYFSNDPASLYHDEFQGLIQRLAELDPLRTKKAKICVMLLGMRTILTKRGKTLVILNVAEGPEKMDVVVFSEVYQSFQDIIKVGEVLLIDGEISIDPFNQKVKMLASNICSVPEARTKFARCLLLHIAEERELTELQPFLKNSPGQSWVECVYKNQTARVRLKMGEAWRVLPTDELLFQLKQILGEERVEVCYGE